MTSALDRPAPTSVLTAWTVQPVALVLAAVLVVGYVHAVRRVDAPWPRGRAVVFGVGIGALLWTSCGFLGVYASSLYWVWTTQTLVLWLGVPILVLFGHPVQLARAVSGPGGRVDRVLRSKPVRTLANPLVGPALVPILSAALFFGPLPAWSITSTPVGWLLQLAVLLIGAVMVLPLVGLDEDASSLAVGLSLAIGSFELVLDALPGVLLRLSTNLVTPYFSHRATYSWSPDALHDQRVAGSVLWCVAEVLDLPFLFLVYRRWLRADARDAAKVDAVLEAERYARVGLPEASGTTADDLDADRDVPWWLSDPAMKQRLRHPH